MTDAVKPATPVREKIARLRAIFLAQLPERMAEIRSTLEALIASADPAQAMHLHRLLHNLKGTGRSFGFRQLGDAAAPAEQQAAELLAAPQHLLRPDWQVPLQQHIALLAQCASAVCLPGSEVADAPGFTLGAIPQQAPAAIRASPGRLIYLCDDEVLTVEQLASQLRCFGYQAVTFLDPKSLCDAMLARRPDAVIMDINFPPGQSDGIKALASLKQDTGLSVPAIFLSARNDFSARLGAVQAGGEAYFHKPARVIELVAAIDALTCHQPSEPYRVLIVDDEPGIAGYHALILQEYGMKTRHLSEPAQVLDVLQEFRPDLVLMDIYMPDCNGRDLAKMIRQLPEYIGMPIVYLSSETDRKIQQSAMGIGAEGFLTKPVIPDELVSAVVIRAERMRHLRALMARDGLTGLFNHTTITQLLDSAIASARRTAGSLCFAMIDIDNFKLVNDSHGHPVGDQVLLAVSRVLQQRLRNTDVVGRYGGEEFAIILKDMTLDQAAKLVDELRTDFSRVAFHAATGDFSCTFSAGVASCARHPQLELLREAADKALYQAKRDGRNRVAVDAAQEESDT